jgi:serine/threonine protein phosphatase PrpC
MPTATALRAAGRTDPGRQRAVNEDRLHVDAAHGLFVVVDGVGGQAAGGKAADVALAMMRARLERETGPVPVRIREAFAIANNEIHRLAATRPEWHGMACVATVAVVEGGKAYVGHVGDTRLYKLTASGIEKITRDHSPIGEREDAGELSEHDAMRHSRRNEVYRDLGSDPHQTGDAEFVDVDEIPVEPGCALLLCSDGLTDLIDSAAIHAIARRFAGQPDRVASALIEAANEAGGKDNVTVVFVEGEAFAGGRATTPAATLSPGHTSNSERYVRVALLVLLTLLLLLSMDQFPARSLVPQLARTPFRVSGGQLVVRPGESISDALKLANFGDEVVVEPGEYRDVILLRSHVRLVSRVPGGAVLRLPASAGEADAAVVASGITGAALVGFRIVGDATSALGTGLMTHDSEVSIVDMEISGARTVAIDVAGASRVEVVASRVHDNLGAALAVGSGSSARITHNLFKRNGASPHTPASFVLDGGADLEFAGNMFYDVTPAAFRGLDELVRAAIARNNWFADPHPLRTAPRRPRGSRS